MKNLRNVTKNGPADGSDFDPEGELNSTLKHSSTFLKKKLLKIEKNYSKGCDIWNFIAAVVGTDTDARHWTFIFLSRTTVRVSFSNSSAGLKIDTFFESIFG